LIRIAEVVFSVYPNDPRPRREAQALRDAGMEVDFYCLLRENQVKKEKVDGMNIHRFNIAKKRTGKFRYIFQYVYFTALVFFLITFKHLKRKYDVVHVHNMPDALVFSALILKLTGTKVILDLHDPMPELFETKYKIQSNHPLIKTVKFFEKISIKFADLVLTPNLSFKNLFVSRGCPENKIHIVMNSPQENIFLNDKIIKQVKSREENQKFVFMFHGIVVERHGLDTAVEALQLLTEKGYNIEFKVFGPGEYTDKFLKLVKELNLENVVNFIGKVKIERIAEEIAGIDLGIIPNKMGPFTNINFPTRIFEYLCLHKPVVVPRTKGITDYFGDDEIYYFNPGDPVDLAGTLENFINNKDKAKTITEAGYKIYAQHTWKKESENLVRLTLHLLNNKSEKILVEENNKKLNYSNE